MYRSKCQNDSIDLEQHSPLLGRLVERVPYLAFPRLRGKVLRSIGVAEVGHVCELVLLVLLIVRNRGVAAMFTIVEGVREG